MDSCFPIRGATPTASQPLSTRQTWVVEEVVVVVVVVVVGRGGLLCHQNEVTELR